MTTDEHSSGARPGPFREILDRAGRAFREGNITYARAGVEKLEAMCPEEVREVVRRAAGPGDPRDGVGQTLFRVLVELQAVVELDGREFPAGPVFFAEVRRIGIDVFERAVCKRNPALDLRCWADVKRAVAASHRRDRSL